jgi:UDP-N-acetylglucosamine acyltransferase
MSASHEWATTTGHVHIGDWVIVGGLTGVHQFTRIGAHAMTGFQSHVSQDVPPFMMAAGHPLGVHGFNVEGLRRRGFSRERIAQVKQMHRLLYRDGLTLEQSKAAIEALKGRVGDPDADADLQLLLDFLAASTRGIAR